MPIQYRNFYIRKLIHVNQKEQENIEKSNSQNSSSPPLAKGPNITRKS